MKTVRPQAASVSSQLPAGLGLGRLQSRSQAPLQLLSRASPAATAWGAVSASARILGGCSCSPYTPDVCGADWSVLMLSGLGLEGRRLWERADRSILFPSKLGGLCRRSPACPTLERREVWGQLAVHRVGEAGAGLMG